MVKVLKYPIHAFHCVTFMSADITNPISLSAQVISVIVMHFIILTKTFLTSLTFISHLGLIHRYEF